MRGVQHSQQQQQQQQLQQQQQQQAYLQQQQQQQPQQQFQQPLQQQWAPSGPPTPARSHVTHVSSSDSAPFNVVDSSGEGAVKRSYGEMKIWVGTWNMGAVDPFMDETVSSNPEEMERLLSPFIPQGYDLYVLGVQEGVSDRVYDAGANASYSRQRRGCMWMV